MQLKDIKLGDATSAKKCLENLQKLPEVIPYSPLHYALQAGELMGLNYLLVFSPEEITFFDESEDALDYMKLIVEMISICNSEEEFISRIFSRPVKEFILSEKTLFPFSRLYLQRDRFSEPNKILSQSLNEYTQWCYLSRPYDETFLSDTLTKLSAEGKKRYATFLFPRLKGHIDFNVSQCKRLLPCWPLNETIPFSNEAGMATNHYNEIEPNTNTFYYGNLWLTKPETFLAIRHKLEKCKLRYLLYNLHEKNISQIFDMKIPGAIYAGLDSTKNFFRWVDCKERWKLAYKNQEGFLCVLTDSGETELIDRRAKNLSRKYKDLKSSLDFMNLEIDEGHIKKREKTFFRKFLSVHPEIKKICQIGFNAGHSAEFFLSCREDITVLSFDIMLHEYGYIGRDYIDFAFPGRHQLIIGDSQETVPRYFRNNPSIKFDMIFIDGSHEEAAAMGDIINCRNLADTNTWVIMDDIDSYQDGKLSWWSEGPTHAWNKAIQEKIVVEQKRKQHDRRGWAIGKFT